MIVQCACAKVHRCRDAEVQKGCRAGSEVQKWCRAIVQKHKASFAEVQVLEARVHLSWMC